MKSKLRISSDGTIAGTHVYARGRDGEFIELSGVAEVQWFADAKTGAAIAHLTVHAPDLQVLADRIDVKVLAPPAPERKDDDGSSDPLPF